MSAVYRKEMRQYFHSVIGYVFLAIFLFINAFYFLLQNLLAGSGDITDFFQATVTLEMFLMPMLTMRSFSEEKKQKTDILLYTMPVNLTDVVCAKFFAAESMLLLGFAATIPFPVIMWACGSMQIWTTLGNYVGIILLMSAFIAIGLFVSSLAENQIVSAIMTYVLIFALWYSYGLGSTIQDPILLAFFNKLSLMQIYYELALGILDLSGIALNLAIISAFLVLTCAVVWGRRLRIAVIVLSVAVIFGIFSVVCAATERFSLKADLTENQVFRLTETTQSILSSIDSPVTFTYLSAASDADTNLKEVLNRYDAASPFVTIDYVDLNANPSFAEEHTKKGVELSPNGLLVTSGIHERFIAWSDLYEIRTVSAGDGSKSYSIAGLKAETMLTSAIVAVSGQECPKVAFTAGHSENDSEALHALLENSNYEVSRIVPGVDPIDKNVDTIIIAGAKRDFSKAEIRILMSFTERGGNLCVFRDPDVGDLPNLDEFLADFGILVGDSIVLEPQQCIDSPLNIIPNFGVSMIGVYFSEHATYLVLPECRNLEIGGANGFITNAVLRSTSASYAKDFRSMSALTQTAEDPMGPFTVAATAEREYRGKDGKTDTQMVFAVGCSDFYGAALLQTDSLGNADLVLQALSQMTDNEVLLNIPTKRLKPDPLFVSQAGILLFGIIFAIMLPLGLLLVGIRVYLKRRHS